LASRGGIADSLRRSGAGTPCSFAVTRNSAGFSTLSRCSGEMVGPDSAARPPPVTQAVATSARAFERPRGVEQMHWGLQNPWFCPGRPRTRIFHKNSKIFSDVKTKFHLLEICAKTGYDNSKSICPATGAIWMSLVQMDYCASVLEGILFICAGGVKGCVSCGTAGYWGEIAIQTKQHRRQWSILKTGKTTRNAQYRKELYTCHPSMH
jgi:hypothetical protein